MKIPQILNPENEFEHNSWHANNFDDKIRKFLQLSYRQHINTNIHKFHILNLNKNISIL